MSLHRYDAKRDANEKEIVKFFEIQGISVERLNTPLDLLLGYNKKNYLVEVKMPGKGLNKNQKEFVKEWRGQWIVIESIDQASKLSREILNNERA